MAPRTALPQSVRRLDGESGQRVRPVLTRRPGPAADDARPDAGRSRVPRHHEPQHRQPDRTAPDALPPGPPPATGKRDSRGIPRQALACPYRNHPDDCGRGSGEREGGDGGFGNVDGVRFIPPPVHQDALHQHDPHARRAPLRAFVSPTGRCLALLIPVNRQH